MHRAALDVVGEGGFVPWKVWIAFCKAGTGVKQRRDAAITAEDMEDRLMLRIRKGEGVEILAEAGVVLPPEWSEGADELPERPRQFEAPLLDLPM